MEVAAGIHRVEAPLGDRYVALYLIEGESGAMLVDTGVASSVADSLLPYLSATGMTAEQIRWVVCTHGDFDHVGGNRAVRAVAPGAALLCGAGDERLLGDVEVIIAERYGELAAEHGVGDSPEVTEWIRSVTNSASPDIVVSGRTAVELGNRTVEILQTPGHSAGHLSIWDARTGSLLIGDAVLHRGLLTAAGSPAFPPTYRDVTSYRSTIASLERLQAGTLLTAHYPVLTGPEVGQFFQESSAYADQLDQAIVLQLSSASEGLTLAELTERLAPAVGAWPEDRTYLLSFPVIGHLEVLEGRGVVVRHRVVDERPRFVLADS